MDMINPPEHEQMIKDWRTLYHLYECKCWEWTYSPNDWDKKCKCWKKMKYKYSEYFRIAIPKW